MDGTNPSGIEPLEFNVLVRQRETEKRTKGGLLLPDEHHERQQWAEVRATVIAMSPRAFDDLGTAPDIGDEVIIAKHAGAVVEGVDGVEYRIIKDKDVVAKVVRHV
jgi:chaperonin GroES